MLVSPFIVNFSFAFLGLFVYSNSLLYEFLGVAKVRIIVFLRFINLNVSNNSIMARSQKN